MTSERSQYEILADLEQTMIREGATAERLILDLSRALRSCLTFTPPDRRDEPRAVLSKARTFLGGSFEFTEDA
jgi:hypothetical protein